MNAQGMQMVTGFVTHGGIKRGMIVNGSSGGSEMVSRALGSVGAKHHVIDAPTKPIQLYEALYNHAKDEDQVLVIDYADWTIEDRQHCDLLRAAFDTGFKSVDYALKDIHKLARTVPNSFVCKGRVVLVRRNKPLTGSHVSVRELALKDRCLRVR